MVSEAQTSLADIVQSYQIEGQLLEVVPYRSGHINDTYLSTFQSGKGTRRYIHQRINHQVFKEPEKVMENIRRVTEYARQQIAARGGDPDRESLTVVPARDGRAFTRTAAGNTWRTYLFIDGARTYHVSDSPQHIYHAARAFGNFQVLLADLPGGRLHETIPDFHHTPKRFAAFVQALEADVKNRAKDCKAEIDFVLQRAADTALVMNWLAQGDLPERVTHNDTKLDNVMIDDQSGEGICVIDLDTTMPGTVLYDFGDMVRMGAATAAEDDPNLERVSVDLNKFETLARGYLDAARGFLTPLEREHLAFGGKLITFEQAIRFLMDYIKGDVYYKTHREGHNLDRARNQIKMVADIEQKMAAMEKIIHRYH